MNRKDTDADKADGRVSPTAPEFVSPSYQAWKEATSDPAFRADVKAGLADVKAKRTKPWSEVRRSIK